MTLGAPGIALRCGRLREQPILNAQQALGALGSKIK